MSDLFALETKRLRLIPLDLNNLRLLKENRVLMEQNLGLRESNLELEENIQAELQEAIDFWMDQVRQHEDEYPWYTNWEIVLKSANRSIGGIGLANVSHVPGQVLVGYGIDVNFRNQGFVSEAMDAIVQWIFSHPDKESMIAETPKENRASQRVLSKSGFSVIEERETTYLWTLHRSHYQSRNGNDKSIWQKS